MARDKTKGLAAALQSLGADQLVQRELMRCLSELETKWAADCVTYVGDIAFGADDHIRDAIEGIAEKHDRIVFVLETSGGFAETARRIADTVRHHYAEVDFLVPSHAMSAGTILVMAGDSIHMDYYSVLGPIDPQIEVDGKLVPALGYLVRYDKLLKKANKGRVSTAEMEILLNFDQGRLYAYEQARDLSRTLLEEWLVKYKWKDWMVTETKRRPVTDAMKRQRAREIAKKLNDVKLWNSHGIGINSERLHNMLNLKIDDFGKTPDLHKCVRSYHKLLIDYMGKLGLTSVIHTRQGIRALG